MGAAALLLVPSGSPRSDFCLRDPLARFDAVFWTSILTFSFNWLRIAREGLSYGFGLYWDVLWSLAIEEQFYLGYPLMLRLLASRRRVVQALVCIVLLGPTARAIAAFWAPESFLWGFTASPAAFDLLAMGALLCFFLERWPARSAKREGLEIAVGLAGAAGVVATYVFSSLDRPWDRVWGPSAIGLSLVLFLVVAIRRSWLDRSRLAFLTAPGQWSYGGYLFHGTTLFLLWHWLNGRGVLVAFGVFATVTLGVAALVYKLYETPTNRAIRRRLGAG